MRLQKRFCTGLFIVLLILGSSVWGDLGRVTRMFNVTDLNSGAPIELVDAATIPRIDFSKGLNLTHWFFLPVIADETMETAAYLQKWMTPTEVHSIAQAGFKHVRLPIDPDFLQPNWQSGDFQIQTERLEAIDRALDLFQADNLGVILDLHPTRRLNLESQPYGSDYQNIETIWRTLSSRYRDRSQMIAYEILNEPLVENAAVWHEMAERLVALIRQVDLSHKIIVPAHGFSGIGELLDFQPITGDRLVYTFHFYNPLVFTHQGATWLPHYAALQNVPYPADRIPPDTVPSLGRSQLPPETQTLWEGYQGSQFNWLSIEAQIKRAAQWRDRYQVSLYCGEYGVHYVAPQVDRYQWHQDVSTALTNEKIGHSLWSYRGIFGLAPDNQLEMDQQLLSAIGLGTQP